MNKIEAVRYLKEQGKDADLVDGVVMLTTTKTGAAVEKEFKAMLNLYRISCEQSGKAEEMRRYRILHAAYIAPEKKSAEEIARENCVEKRTYYSDLGKAVKPLSALIFGIDGIRLA